MLSNTKMSLIEVFAALGEIAGPKGRINVSIDCDDGMKNKITWEAKYSPREPMIVRALKVLHDGVVLKREDNEQR